MSDAPENPDTLAQLWDFLEDDSIEVPNVKSVAHPEGKTYLVASPSAELGLRLTALSELAAKVVRNVEVTEADVRRIHLDDAQEREFMREVLGVTYDEMMADGVSWVRLSRIGQYCFIYFTQGPETANQAAQAGLFTGGKVRRVELNRQERRHPTTQETPSDRPGSTATSRRRRR